MSTLHGTSGLVSDRRVGYIGPAESVPSPADPDAGRIPGLDGLRAIAVVAVLAFHLWPSVVRGGYLGVDVFFVISGFLITTLLLRERARGRQTDLVGFWRRRVRRLIPALVLVVVTSVAAARIVSGGLLVNIHRQVLGAATFSTNWVEIIAGGDYFDQTTPSLFLTFWSLAVEEQFYLIWPIVFVVSVAAMEHGRRRRYQLWPMPLVLAIGSAVLMAVKYQGAESASRVYYGTDTHAFGIMLGVSLAFAFSLPTKPMSTPAWRRSRGWLGPLALLGLVPLVLLLDSDSAFAYRGGILLASVLTLTVLATLPGEETALTCVLAAKPLTWIGDRSYGIYLWHWPVLLIVLAIGPPTAPGELLSPVTAAIVLAITFGLSALSFRYVEVKVIKGGFSALWSGPEMRLVGGPGRSGAGMRRGTRSTPPDTGTRVAFGAFGVLVCIAIVGMVTAPKMSEAEKAVSDGLALIEDQQALTQTGKAPADDGGTGVDDESNGSSTGEVGEDADGDVDGSSDEPGVKDGTGVLADIDPSAPVPGDRIVGIGDSVMSGVASGLYQEFPGIYLDAKPNRQWPVARTIVDSMLANGTMRDVVVLQFGTNAGLNGDVSKQALNDVLDALGPDRLIVIPTVVGVSSWVPSTNETMRSIAADHPNVFVADWNAVVRNNPGLLHDDRTHPNLKGMQAYADLLSQTIESARGEFE